MARRGEKSAPAVPSPVPREVDLVVAPHGPRWAVGPFGSRAQVSFATFEAAVAHARGFASARSLDVWLTDDGMSFRRADGNREPGSA